MIAGIQDLWDNVRAGAERGRGNQRKIRTYTSDVDIPEGVERSHAPMSRNDFTVKKSENQAAVDRIVYDTVCAQRRAMTPGGRLFVVMGETHPNPVHRMAQAGLLENLALGDVAGRVFYAHEMPYDNLYDTALGAYKVPMAPALRPVFHAYDTDGRLTARARAAKSFSTSAPVALCRVFATCALYDIPVAMVDAGRINLSPKVSFLSSEDELACAQASEHFDGFDLSTMFVSEAMEMGIRNAVMAERIVEKAKDRDIVVVGTGMNHIMDTNSARRKNPKYLLPSFLRQKIGPKDKILPVLFDSEEHDLKLDFKAVRSLRRNFPDMVLIRGASDEMFGDNVYKDEMRNALLSRKGQKRMYRYTHIDDAEKKHIERLAESFGGDVPRRFADDIFPLSYEVELELRLLAKEAEQAERQKGLCQTLQIENDL